MVPGAALAAATPPLPTEPGARLQLLSATGNDHYPTVWEVPGPVPPPAMTPTTPSVVWTDPTVPSVWRYHSAINGGTPVEVSWNTWPPGGQDWWKPVGRHDPNYPNTWASPTRPDHAGSYLVYEDYIFGDQDLFHTTLGGGMPPYDDHWILPYHFPQCDGEDYRVDDDTRPSVAESGLVAFEHKTGCSRFTPDGDPPYTTTIVVAKLDGAYGPGSQSHKSAYVHLHPNYNYRRPSMWEQYVAYEKDAGAGEVYLAYVETDAGNNYVWNEHAVSNGTLGARFPHVHDHRVVYERANLNGEWELYERVFDSTGQMLTSETAVPTSGTCTNYRRPRVGGPAGSWVLYVGEDCTEGGVVYPNMLYLTDLSTAAVYLVAEIVAGPDTEPTEYDIFNNWIVRRDVGAGIMVEYALLP